MTAQVYVEELEGYCSLTSNLRFSTTEHSRVTVRITVLDADDSTSPSHYVANSTPAGLIAFAFITIFNNLKHYMEPGWAGHFACLALFHGGLVQFTCGIIELHRNNIFGGTAFMSFGALWMSDGLYQILVQTENLPAVEAPNADCMKVLFTNVLAMMLLVQAFKMNMALLTLVSTLVIFFFLDGFQGYDADGVLPTVVHVVGTLLGGIAIYLALAELTNEIYNRVVLPIRSFNNSHGAWSAPGRSVSVRHHVARLRDNQKPPGADKSSSIYSR